MRNAFFVFLAVLTTATPVHAQDAEVDARIRRVENGLSTAVMVAGRGDQGLPIAERMRVHRTPNVSIAVINDGRIEWARAYGALQAGAAADTATLFQAASISKPVATLGMLRLMERGEVSLDEDVNRYMRTWRVPENAFTAREKVTLRRIVSHSAGLTVSGFPGYAADAALPTTVQILDGERPANTAPVRVDTLPGARLRYSGGAMTVMQQMLVDLAGRPFPLFMRETVLLPLGMVHSSYDQDVTPERAARVARAHEANGTPTPGGWHRYPEMAAAGLWTTPQDLARFALAVNSAFRGAEGGVVSPALARQILAQQSGGPDGGFGLGMEVHPVEGGVSFGHSGSNKGYRARMIAFTATGDGAVVMTNSDAGAELIMEILRALAVEYGWPELRPVQKTAVAVDRDALAYAPGHYQGTFQGQPVRYTIEAADGALRLVNATWLAPRTLYPASTTEARFFIRESEREYTVERDASGRAVRIRVTGGGAPEFVVERLPD